MQGRRPHLGRLPVHVRPTTKQELDGTHVSRTRRVYERRVPRRGRGMQFAPGGWPSTVLVELLWVPGVHASANGPVSEWVSARTSLPPPSSSSSGSRTDREWLLTSRRRRPRPRCRPTVETRPRPSLDRPRRGRPGDSGRTPSAGGGFVSSFSWSIRFAEGFRSRVPCGRRAPRSARIYRSSAPFAGRATPRRVELGDSLRKNTVGSVLESNTDRIVTLDLRYTRYRHTMVRLRAYVTGNEAIPSECQEARRIAA